MGERTEEVGEIKIRIKPAKEGGESYVTVPARGEAEGGVPRLVNDFQDMVKKYVLEQVGIVKVEKIEVRVTRIF